MKKILYLCVLSVLLLWSQKGAAQLSLAVTPASQCLYVGLTQFSVTTAPAGVTSYSWGVLSPTGGSVSAYTHTTTAGVNNSFNYLSCGVYTTYCWALSGTTIMTLTTITNTILCQPSVSVTGGGTLCAGSSATLTASGASTYTWYPNGGSPVVGSSLVVTPTANICYTVVGVNAGGCTGAQFVCITVSSPSISIVGSSSVCIGYPNSLYALGGTSYTWSTGSNANGITTTTAGCYTVTGITGCGGGTASASFCFTNIPFPTVTASASSTLVCPGAPVILSFSGTSNYTVTPGFQATSSSSAVVYPATTTNYTIQGYNVPGYCPGYAYVTVSVTPAPPITVSGSGTVCAGTSATLTLAGASSYTWSNGSTGSVVVLSPTATTCYSVIGVTSGGCYSSALACVYVHNTTVGIAGGSGVCAGGTATLSGSGASTYTWLPGNIVSSGISVTPTASTCYSVTGTDSFGCTNSAVHCVAVTANPTVTIAGSATACSGSNAVFTASGASGYVWNTGATTSSIVVSATGSTCYSVTGFVGSGCSSMASLCLTVEPTPTITVSGSSTICAGSSDILTASGASSYSWSTGAATSTVQVSPVSTTTYIVSGTGANGCVGYGGVAVTVYTNCTIVWPGDANSDGVVDNTDVFEIGLAYSNTGAPRSPGGNTYSGQYANVWAGTVSTGANKAHADCNGDGTINNGDTVAISLNYSLSHSFRPSGTSALADMTFIPTQPVLLAGEWNSVDIELGDVSNQISQLYGVAFDVNYNGTMVQANSVYLTYTPSFLNASNQQVQFRKGDAANSKIYAASVRTDATTVNGGGKIAELHFKLNQNISANQVFDLSISNVHMINHTGVSTVLTGGSVALTTGVTGIKAQSSLQANTRCYPNPAADQLTVQNNSGSKVNFSICDIVGKEIMKGEFTGSKTIDLSSFQKGAYLIRFESGADKFYQKLIIEK